MPAKAKHRKPGPPKKPGNGKEAELSALESQIRPARRRLSGKARAFIAAYSEAGFKDAEAAARSVGYSEPFVGGKLVGRLGDLIEAEKVRAAMQEQMELDEALRLTAQLARTADRDVDKLQALRTILQVHGVLSDKPLPPTDRRSIARQVAEMIERVQRTASTSPGARVKVRAMVGASLEVSSESPPADSSPSESPQPPPASFPLLPTTANTYTVRRSGDTPSRHGDESSPVAPESPPLPSPPDR